MKINVVIGANFWLISSEHFGDTREYAETWTTSITNKPRVNLTFLLDRNFLYYNINGRPL